MAPPWQFLHLTLPQLRELVTLAELHNTTPHVSGINSIKTIPITVEFEFPYRYVVHPDGTREEDFA